MSARYVLSEYINHAMTEAVYDKLEDGSFAGRIPSCKGVVSLAATLRECESELRSVLEDWILLGIKLGHPLPVIGGIDLNREPAREPVDALLSTATSSAAFGYLASRDLSPGRAALSWFLPGIAWQSLPTTSIPCRNFAC